MFLKVDTQCTTCKCCAVIWSDDEYVRVNVRKPVDDLPNQEKNQYKTDCWSNGSQLNMRDSAQREGWLEKFQSLIGGIHLASAEV